MAEGIEAGAGEVRLEVSAWLAIASERLMLL